MEIDIFEEKENKILTELKLNFMLNMKENLLLKS